MAEKDTGQLEHDLKAARGVEGFWATNPEELEHYTASEYLHKLLAEKGLKRSEVIKDSGLNPEYASHIFAGRKNTSRKYLLAIALAMGLTTKETQHLLHYADVGELYVRDPWDSVLWFALEHRMTVMETNLLLHKLSQSPLCK
ncbi:MAG: helix-turn-helix transcriptional regulator [Schwartzia sp.]|nr:helix-turn-helix transcriptional regulator [Schwartzia sp. (in: firmicutes)]